MCLHLVERIPGGSRPCPAARVCGKYIDGASRVDGRCAGLLSRLRAWACRTSGESGPVVLAGLFPGGGNPAAGGASACGFGACTGPYVAVRRIGGREPARTYI